MKPEDTVCIASSSESRDDTNEALQKPHSFTKSALARLCRKLSHRKASEKRSMAAGLDQDCNELMKRVFRYFDVNGDGKISPAELQSCVRTVGGEMSPEEAETAVRSSDSDGDGELGLDDFAKLMEAGGEEEREEELREAFGMYAAEGDGGCITPNSLKRMLSRLGESTTVDNCKAMIRKFDVNGDGVLNFDEFSLMMH